MTRLAEVEAALRALTLGSPDGHELAWPDAPRDRQQLVRSMVRRNLIGILERACPHARRIVGESAFGVVCDRFVSSGPLHTRLTREIPSAFASWLLREVPSPLALASTATREDVGSCFAELCHFETLEIEITLALTTTSHSGEPSDDAFIEIDGSARLAVYRHPVHEVRTTTTALPAAATSPVVLLCFQRDEALRIEVIEPAVGKVLVAAAAGAPVGEAIARVCAEAQDTAFDRDAIRQRLVHLHRLGAIAGFDRSAASSR